MFEQIEKGWSEERERAKRWTVYRAWIGTGIALLVPLLHWLEKNPK
jgi:hypothetical protein